MRMSYASWFRSTAGFDPHPWQLQLGEASACTDRVLRIDTTGVHVLARFVIDRALVVARNTARTPPRRLWRIEEAKG